MRGDSFMAGAFAWELGNPHFGKATPATRWGPTHG